MRSLELWCLLFVYICAFCFLSSDSARQPNSQPLSQFHYLISDDGQIGRHSLVLLHSPAIWAMFCWQIGTTLRLGSTRSWSWTMQHYSSRPERVFFCLIPIAYSVFCALLSGTSKGARLTTKCLILNTVFVIISKCTFLHRVFITMTAVVCIVHLLWNSSPRRSSARASGRTNLLSDPTHVCWSDSLSSIALLIALPINRKYYVNNTNNK